MIKLLIVGVGRNLHHTYNTIRSCYLNIPLSLRWCPSLSRNFHPCVERRPASGCRVQRCTGRTVHCTGHRCTHAAVRNGPVTIPSSCVMDCHGCSISSAQCQVKPTFVGVQLRLGRRYCLSHKYDTTIYSFSKCMNRPPILSERYLCTNFHLLLARLSCASAS